MRFHDPFSSFLDADWTAADTHALQPAGASASAVASVSGTIVGPSSSVTESLEMPSLVSLPDEDAIVNMESHRKAVDRAGSVPLTC